jgi:hypothetical protein
MAGKMLVGPKIPAAAGSNMAADPTKKWLRRG